MSKCIVCGGKFYDEPLMEMDNLPKSAQNIPNLEDLDKDKGITIKLCQCKNCGLVQIDGEPVKYYKDTIRTIGNSTTMIDMRKKQYKHLIEKYNLINKKIIEIGCGQGEFLEILKEYDVQAYGIENLEKSVMIAKKKGLNVEKNFAENEKTIIKNGPFNAFLSFNFLEHQPDPNGMLQAIYNNLTDDGVGLITVPSFEDILENDGFYEIIRDHVCYYTIDTLKFLLNKNGFEVIEDEIINGDTLSVIVSKRKKINVDRFKNNYVELGKEINDYIDKMKSKNKKVVVWGASHQGFTIISTANIKNKIECIIDSSLLKQGKYSPVSHLKIVSPEECRCTILKNDRLYNSYGSRI